MDRRSFLKTATVGLSGSLLAGCGESGESGTPTESPTPTGTPEPDVVIAFEEGGIVPTRTRIDPMARVRIENNTDETRYFKSRIIHDRARSWAIGEKLTPDESAQLSPRTFEREGAYEFVGLILGAEQACGVVLVGDVTWDERLPCEVS